MFLRLKLNFDSCFVEFSSRHGRCRAFGFAA
jgi:hypothetical protein